MVVNSEARETQAPPLSWSIDVPPTKRDACGCPGSWCAARTSCRLAHFSPLEEEEVEEAKDPLTPRRTPRRLSSDASRSTATQAETPRIIALMRRPSTGVIGQMLL